MRIINTKCWVDWKTGKGLRRTEQTSFNVSFQKKKIFSHVTGSLEYNNVTEDPGSFLLFILLVSMCVLHIHMYGSSITCTVQASHVYLPSPGAGKGPFLLHVGLFKKVSYDLEASHPQPPGLTGPTWHAYPYTRQWQRHWDQYDRYFHSGFAQGAVAQR